ncbi:peptide methionine sulfoxide reductase msrA/msrB [Lachnospiraceae bacterium PF1-22]|uniref:peptide-methionine (R)-S-oxide reductase MsrB n=1 Tax=Ohessyouella blattaphilus TaxID=2949333 RepID=UPI003E1852F4
MKEIYLGMGCFWGGQAYFEGLPGIRETEVGYANGRIPMPTYTQVCKGDTGFAEVVRLKYDEQVMGLSTILDMYFAVIDPVSVNRQGNDVGEQYRTGIYYTDPSDKAIVEGAVILLSESFKEPLAIEVGPLQNYYPAEEYHQQYLAKNPTGYCHISLEQMAAARELVESIKHRHENKEDLREKLTPLQYEVTQNGATEAPFKNEYYDNFSEGIYVDIVSGKPLFVSTDKFESGCGWPSFSKPIEEAALKELEDLSYGRERTEIRSANSGAHLGHVFNDGPEELGGLRYCINSAALEFIPKAEMAAKGYEKYLPLLETK